MHQTNTQNYQLEILHITSFNFCTVGNLEVNAQHVTKELKKKGVGAFQNDSAPIVHISLVYTVATIRHRKQKESERTYLRRDFIENDPVKRI